MPRHSARAGGEGRHSQCDHAGHRMHARKCIGTVVALVEYHKQPTRLHACFLWNQIKTQIWVMHACLKSSKACCIAHVQACMERDIAVYEGAQPHSPVACTQWQHKLAKKQQAWEVCTSRAVSDPAGLRKHACSLVGRQQPRQASTMGQASPTGSS